MADALNWGILATGGIARQFARSLKHSKTGTLVAVGSRTQESADKFCEQHGGTPYGSYEAVLADPNVQAIYIALPHHLHGEWTIKCAEAGKAILCEKPFTLNLLEAERALAEVKKHNVFFMEAFMYHCHPMTLKVKELADAGAIGKILNINAEFGFQAGKNWDNFRADGALGGGGLMDVGTYCVSFSRLIAGEEPDRAFYAAYINEKGYDEHGSGVLSFPNGINAHFGTGVHVSLNNNATIYGEDGRIEVFGPWRIDEKSKIVVYARGKDPETYTYEFVGDALWGFEADAVAEFIDAKEAPYMTLADTLGEMRALDMLRASAGLSFAMEAKS